MFRGRILIVSDRSEVVAELDLLIRAEGHLSLVVPDADEALQVLEDGIIPDVVIGDLRPGLPGGQDAYLSRFRRLNQLGRFLAVVDPDRAALRPPQRHPRTTLQLDPFEVLAYPFAETQVRSSIQQAMEQIRRDLESLRSEMLRETARLQKAMQEAQLELVTALAMMMEAKDRFMQGHCERVAALCRRVAEAMQVEEDQVERLATAALLHEIGKVGVSLELLHKDSPLTPAELELIRGHTRAGSQIVSAVPSLSRLAPLIANQYADYRDLAAEVHPEAAEFLLICILRLIDVYDAMTSDRSYRRVLSRERWEAEIRAGVGIKFHPQVVEAFFGVIAATGTAPPAP
jgi:CheY-like chemotaxis protein